MISYLSVSAGAHSVNDQTQLKKKKKKCCSSVLYSSLWEDQKVVKGKCKSKHVCVDSHSKCEFLRT